MQQSFLAFSNTVMSQDRMTDAQVTALLNQMGLNSKQFLDTMHSQAVKEQLMQGECIMNASGNNHVPLFIIYLSALDSKYGITLAGVQSLQTMEYIIQQELKTE